MSLPRASRRVPVARLAAVQALYQMEVSGVGAEAVVREFVDHRFDRDIDGRPAMARGRRRPSSPSW